MTTQGTIAEVLAGRADWAFECRDGFALARELADGAVDHVIGDPPYDKRTHSRARSLKDGGSDIKIDFAVLPSLDKIVPSMIRAAKRWVIAFCAIEQIGEYSRCATENWIRAGIWVRTNGTPQISSDRPAQGAEGIAIMHGAATKKRWNRGGNRGVWTGGICKDPRRMHPTKKPPWLMEALLRDFTDPGELIFDPTSGEGTTGEACIKLGRRFIGCEIDPKYHAAGLARLTRASNGMKQIDLLAI